MIALLKNPASKIYLLILFLLPIFYWSRVGLDIEVTKTTFAYIGILLIVFLWLIPSLRVGKIETTVDGLQLGLGLVLLPIIYQAITSSNPALLISSLVYIFWFLLTFRIFKKTEEWLMVYLAVVASAIVLFIFQLIWYFINPGLIIIGSSFDLVILFGYILILVIYSLINFSLSSLRYGNQATVALGVISILVIVQSVYNLPIGTFWPIKFDFTNYLSLLWIVFGFYFVFYAYKTINFLRQSTKPNPALLLSLISSIYFWASLLKYNPGVVVTVLAYVFLGLWVSAMIKAKIITEKFVVLKKGGPWSNFFTIFISLSVLALTLIGAKYQFAYFKEGQMASVDASTSEYFRSAKSAFDELRALVSQPDAPVESEEFISRRDALANQAVTFAKKAVEDEPDDYRNWALYGEIASMFIAAQVPNAIEEAIGAYERAIVLKPDNTEIITKYAQTLALVANTYLQNNDLASARVEVEKLSRLTPNDYSVWWQLGRLDYMENNFEASDQHFKTSLELLPNDANLLYQLALFYSGVNDTDRAIAAIDEALSIDPNNLDALTLKEQISPQVSAEN